ncbi:MAG: hypothetical protein AAFN92_08565, partial [Bacteroidota bacterium]
LNMTLERMKLDLISRILMMRDERLVGSIHELVVKEEAPKLPSISRYITPIEQQVDIEKLKLEQQWERPREGEIDQLIEEADIQESLETLLSDLG